MAATMIRTASYKGKTYKVLFIGATKFGQRAHLAFMDGGKDFWVDAALVTETVATPRAARPHTVGGCRGCGDVCKLNRAGYCGDC